MKGRTAHELLDHPRRLRVPLRRDGDRYVETTWDEAIADIAARLTAIADTHGPDAVGAYTGNPIGFNGANGLFFIPFMRAIGSRNVFGVGSVDQNNLHRVCFEMYGRWLVPLVPDVDACDYFLLLGMDPAVSTFVWIPNVPDPWRRPRRRGRGRRVARPRAQRHHRPPRRARRPPLRARLPPDRHGVGDTARAAEPRARPARHLGLPVTRRARRRDRHTGRGTSARL